MLLTHETIEQDRRVNTPEASRLVGVSTATLKNWREADQGPAYTKVCGRYWYTLSDLQRFIAAGYVDPSLKAEVA